LIDFAGCVDRLRRVRRTAAPPVEPCLHRVLIVAGAGYCVDWDLSMWVLTILVNRAGGRRVEAFGEVTRELVDRR
jgi:hypothetical protein